MNDARALINSKEEEITRLNRQMLSERTKLLCSREAIVNRTLEFLSAINRESGQLHEVLLPKQTSELSTTNTLRVLDAAIGKRKTVSKRINSDLGVISEEDTDMQNQSCDDSVSTGAGFDSSKEASSRLNLSHDYRPPEQTETDYDLQMDPTGSGSSALTSTPFPKNSTSSCNNQNQNPNRGLASAESASSYPKRPMSSICNSGLNKPYETCIFSVGNLINSTPYRRMQQESFFMEQTLSDTVRAEILNNMSPNQNDACNLTFGLDNFEQAPNATPSIFHLPQEFDDSIADNSSEVVEKHDRTYEKVIEKPAAKTKAKATKAKLKAKDVTKEVISKSNKESIEPTPEPGRPQLGLSGLGSSKEDLEVVSAKPAKRRGRIPTKRKNDDVQPVEATDKANEKTTKSKEVSKAKKLRKNPEPEAETDSNHGVRRSKRISNKK